MKRLEFIKKALATGALSTLVPNFLEARQNYTEVVGFNHLPNKEITTMNSVYIHPIQGAMQIMAG